MKDKRSDFCGNCHFPLPYKARFCPQCGQKVSDGRISIGSLLQQLWLRVLHLESRSLRFLWHLLIPGRVTAEYFSGKRKRYPPPIQFFFVVMFLFLFTLNHVVGTGGLQLQSNTSGVRIKQAESGQPKVNFYDLGRQYAEVQRMRQEFDSLPESYRTPAVRQAIDSLMRRTYGGATRKLGEIWAEATDSLGADAPDSMMMNLGLQKIKIASIDLFQLDADGLIQKYGVNSWLEQTLLRQGVKTMKEPEALMKSYLGSLAWTILALVALMSFVLALLYWRQKRYYVEHFIFLLNIHSGMFLLLTAAFWLNFFFRLHWQAWTALAIWLAISPTIALRLYYGQGLWATFFKSLLFSIIYLVGFVLLFAAGILVVFVLF